MDISVITSPHEEAARLIAGKRVVSRDVFYGMLPELRGRAFAVSGVEAANVLQRIRDGIASLAQGVGEDGKPVTWDRAKQDLMSELDPFLGEGAEKRATLLLRTHGFQAFEASNWRVAQEDADTTHLQYLATEDDRVRDSHLALNGLVLPKDDPFWDTHLPPWEWGCRCRVRPMNPDLVALEREKDAARNPEDRNVISGAALDQLRGGTLLRNGQRYDVTPPVEQGRDMGGPSAAYQWHPDDLRLSVGELQQRYEPEVWSKFEAWCKQTLIDRSTTLWNWMMSKPAKLSRADLQRVTRVAVTRANQSRAAGKEGNAGDLGLRTPGQWDLSGRASGIKIEAGKAKLASGFTVTSMAGTEVRFAKIAQGHLESDRIRFLPAAELVAKAPAEIWENGLRRYYLGKVARRKGGVYGVVLVTARKQERADEVLTYFLKSWREIERLRSGKLIYEAGK